MIMHASGWFQNGFVNATDQSPVKPEIKKMLVGFFIGPQGLGKDWWFISCSVYFWYVYYAVNLHGYSRNIILAD